MVTYSKKTYADKYFDKYKKDIFPEIKDWSDPQNEYRFCKDILHMKYKYWFWFAPSAYHLITYSFFIMNILTFGALSVYTGLRGIYIITIIAAVVAIASIPKLYDKIKMHSMLKYQNFYDVWLREW